MQKVTYAEKLVPNQSCLFDSLRQLGLANASVIFFALLASNSVFVCVIP